MTVEMPMEMAAPVSSSQLGRELQKKLSWVRALKSVRKSERDTCGRGRTGCGRERE
jgi:hypothetical protein